MICAPCLLGAEVRRNLDCAVCIRWLRGRHGLGPKGNLVTSSEPLTARFLRLAHDIPGVVEIHATDSRGGSALVAGLSEEMDAVAKTLGTMEYGGGMPGSERVFDHIRADMRIAARVLFIRETAGHEAARAYLVELASV